MDGNNCTFLNGTGCSYGLFIYLFIFLLFFIFYLTAILILIKKCRVYSNYLDPILYLIFNQSVELTADSQQTLYPRKLDKKIEKIITAKKKTEEGKGRRREVKCI